MTFRRRKPLRHASTWTLVLAVVALSGLDPALCRCVDGDLGLETLPAVCCAPVIEAEACCVRDAEPCLAGPRSGDEGGSCDHTSLLRWIPRPSHHDAPVAWDAPAPFRPRPLDGGTVAASPAPYVADPILVQLRSTTLLV